MAIGSGTDATPGTGRNYLKLFMALLCLSAVGIAGSTYDSTLKSDPDEIIDVKHEWLPIGKEKIQNFKDPQSSANQASSGGGGGSDEEPAPCTGGIVGFLGTLFPSLIPPCGPFYLLGLFLPVLLLIAGSALTYRYRRRIAAPAIAVAGWLQERPWASDDEGTAAWPRREPTNDVHRAWLSMIEQADVEQPWTRTPGECARAAVDAGLEFEGVDTVTQLFVEVKYAGEALTADRQQQARRWRERLTDGAAQPQRADGGSNGDQGSSGGQFGRVPGLRRVAALGRVFGMGLWPGSRGEDR